MRWPGRPWAGITSKTSGADDRDVVTEHGLRLSSGGWQVRNSAGHIEAVYPLARWIEHERRHGAVYRRRIIVVDDWAEVGEDQAGELMADRLRRGELLTAAELRHVADHPGQLGRVAGPDPGVPVPGVPGAAAPGQPPGHDRDDVGRAGEQVGRPGPGEQQGRGGGGGVQGAGERGALGSAAGGAAGQVRHGQASGTGA